MTDPGQPESESSGVAVRAHPRTLEHFTRLEEKGYVAYPHERPGPTESTEPMSPTEALAAVVASVTPQDIPLEPFRQVVIVPQGRDAFLVALTAQRDGQVILSPRE